MRSKMSLMASTGYLLACGHDTSKQGRALRAYGRETSAYRRQCGQYLNVRSGFECPFGLLRSRRTRAIHLLKFQEIFDRRIGTLFDSDTRIVRRHTPFAIFITNQSSTENL